MPNLAPLGIEQARSHEVTRRLMSLSSISGVKVEIKKTFWPKASNYDSLPDRIPGALTRWNNKAELKLSVLWFHG